tara:strand:- start:49 stop:756 length:708 start_codon:yes stop_codon:yes gene_type:complete
MIVSKDKAIESCHNFWQIHNTEKGYPENYPDEEVVRFLMRLKSTSLIEGKKLKDIKILDLGTGSGKNIQPVLDIGFKLYVIDWSNGGLNYIRKKVKKKKINFSCLDFVKNKLPYKKDFFDGVIAISIFDHIFKKDAERLLKEVSRVSKKDAMMISNLMTTNTNKKNRLGTKIKNEKNTYLVKSGNSAGEIHSLFPKAQAQKFYSKYFSTMSTIDYSILYNKKEKLNYQYSNLKKI